MFSHNVSSQCRPEDKKTAQEKKAALNDKVAEKQAAIKKKEDARQKAFPEILVRRARWLHTLLPIL